MNILYVGDIMGEPGVRVVTQLLPELRQKYHIDMVIAQGENVTEGRGISLADYQRLRTIGIDFLTGGNWSLHREDTHELLNNPSEPIIRPANYPPGTVGKVYKERQMPGGLVLVVSLLGQIVGKDADKPVDNPLQVIDQILKETKHVKYVAKVVNFHGDYSSEKLVIGHYLDGQVTAVIGDHWHIPTADARVLPRGTAHITDVGMCGSLDSSLGVKLNTVIERWRNGRINRNELEKAGPLQFNAVLINTDSSTVLAQKIKQIRQIAD